MDAEAVFRRDLLDHALAGRWPDWHTTRLVFADWLEERDRPEHAMCRADWRHVWEKRPMRDTGRSDPPPDVVLFEVATSGPTKGGVGRLNATTLLHFAPSALKLLRHIDRHQDSIIRWPTYAVQFSWCPSRARATPNRYRTDLAGSLWPRGFPELWLEPIRKDASAGQRLLFA